MNPLCRVNENGYVEALREHSRESFRYCVKNLYLHFVKRGEWLDSTTLCSIPKENTLSRMIKNIVSYVKYKIFNSPPVIPFNGIQNGLCSYIRINADYLGEIKQDLDKDLIIKLINISLAISKKYQRSFLKKQGIDLLLPGNNPILNIPASISKNINLGTVDNCEKMFEVLGWDWNEVNL